jgi:hypothetical protein
VINANVRRGRADTAELAPRRSFVALAMLAAISAWLGAAALIAQRAGGDFAPISLLAHTPFASFLVPGLLLGGVVGGSCAAAALLAWRRSRAAPVRASAPGYQVARRTDSPTGDRLLRPPPCAAKFSLHERRGCLSLRDLPPLEVRDEMARVTSHSCLVPGRRGSSAPRSRA